MAFEDISTTGTQITEFVPFSFDTDRLLTSTDLNGFDFDFFGTNYSELYVNADGTITFDGASGEIQFDTDWQETDPVRPRIAPLWGEFNTFNSEPYDTYWQVKDAGTSSERLIVQWDNYNFLIDTGTGANETVTFQAVLQSNGDILFSYQDLDVSDPIDTEGRTATVGIATDSFLFPETIPADVFVDGPHKIPGINIFFDDEYTGVENDFVRLAWETGGAAWNNDTISGISKFNQTLVDALNVAFIESIGDQILRKNATGDVVFAEDVFLEINLGGPTSGSFIGDTDYEMQKGIDIFPNVTTVTTTTTSITVNGNSMSGDSDTLAVFETARMATGSDDLIIDLPASEVPNGSYVVELMFAEHSDLGGNPTNRIMDVSLEGVLMMNGYVIELAFDKLPTAVPVAPEFEQVTERLSKDVPTVKRFAVDVTDGNGLQIVLDSINSGLRASVLNGLRILNAPDADFDIDTDVDGSDFLAWQRGLGTLNATKADGDADNDQDVDATDLAIWQSQYGLGAAAAASSMQGGGAGGSSMMQSGTNSQANVAYPQAVTQKIVPQLTPKEAAEKKESIFQLQKAFIEFLFKADLIPDVTEDGLIDRADLRVLVEPMLEVNPEVETERLIREIRIPTETVASFDDALEELMGKEQSLSAALVGNAVELL